MSIIIDIKRDFTDYPGLRYCSISEKSGEEFYHTMLNEKFHEAWEKNEKLTVVLDGTEGFAPSFIDEAFGNLVYDFTLKEVERRIEIISNEEKYWVDRVKNATFLEWESRRKSNSSPRITKDHNPWFRLINGKSEKKKWEVVK